jgi:hypothetical protein
MYSSQDLETAISKSQTKARQCRLQYVAIIALFVEAHADFRQHSLSMCKDNGFFCIIGKVSTIISKQLVEFYRPIILLPDTGNQESYNPYIPTLRITACNTTYYRSIDKR